LVLFALGASAVEPPGGDSISFQIHSYNDLFLWPQALRKGSVIWAKVDPAWVPPEGCATQHGVANASDPRGCFLLSHDNPLPSERQYNTTEDLVRLVQQPELRPFFADPEPSRKRHIALCFKNAPGRCDNTTEAANWRSLVTDTLAAFDGAIRQQGLNLEIVLDGDASPNLPCLVPLWRPHNSTYISLQDPAGAFESNNATNGYDRYQIVNEPTVLFDLAADLKFGKFAQQEVYNYLIWEPSDQPEIEHYADSYLKVGQPHVPAGFRYAINIDSAQWRVYAASRTGTAWSDLVVPLPNVSRPLSVAVPRNVVLLQEGSMPLPDVPGMPGDLQIITVFQGEAGGWQWVANPSNTLGGRLAPGSTPPSYASPLPLHWNSTWELPASLVSASAQSFPDGSQFVCLGGDAPATLSCFEANTIGTTTAMEPSAQLELPVHSPTVTTLSVRVLPCQAVSTTSTSLCTVSLVASASSTTLLSWGCTLASKTPQWVGVAAMLVGSSGESVAILCVAEGPLDMATLSGGVTLSVPADPSRVPPGSASQGGVVFSAAGAVFSSPLCSHFQGGAAVLQARECVPGMGHSTALHQVHVGAHADVVSQVVETPGSSWTVLVADTHTDGFCQNSETHNKQAVPATCVFAQQNATTTPLVLNYNFGQWGHWSEQSVGNDPTGPMQSPCADRVFAGAFGMGGDPSPWLFVGNAAPAAGTNSTGAVAGLMVSHTGIPSGTSDGGCGIARSQEGLVIDGWSFPLTTGVYD
jgi:hypothetical protein